MVSEVEHFLGVVSAKLQIHCLSKTVSLVSISHRNVSDFAMYVDAKVNSIRLNMRTWEQMMEANIQDIDIHSPYVRPALDHRIHASRFASTSSRK